MNGYHILLRIFYPLLNTKCTSIVGQELLPQLENWPKKARKEKQKTNTTGDRRPAHAWCVARAVVRACVRACYNIVDCPATDQTNQPTTHPSKRPSIHPSNQPTNPVRVQSTYSSTSTWTCMCVCMNESWPKVDGHKVGGQKVKRVCLSRHRHRFSCRWKQQRRQIK